jgi:nitroreductase
MPIQKPALSEYPINTLINDRWSPRAFDSKTVEDSKLMSLLEAARWAASCNNSQPWRFIISKSEDKDAHDKAVSCFNERNQRWVKNAPVIGFVCAYKLMPNENPNRTYFYDTGMAMAQLSLQALEHNLYLHQAGGILIDKITADYSIPDNVDVVCGFGLGYQGEAESLPDELAERELEARKRNLISEFTFSNKFGEISKIFSNK